MTEPRKTRPRMDSPPKGLSPECTQPRVDSTPKGLNPEMTQSRLGLNPEWTQPWLGLNPEWTQPRLGLKPDRDSTSNSYQPRMAPFHRPNIKIVLFSLNMNQGVLYIKRMDLKIEYNNI
jgi:hypothetical protein